MNSEKFNRISRGLKACLAGLVLLWLSGCASNVRMLNGAKLDASAKACNVTIHQTLKSAERNGPIEELCIITDDMGLRPINDAIQANKANVCKCGAKHAYVQNASGSLMTQVVVTLVGFKYLEQATPTPPIDDPRASQCRSKGGTLVKDTCQLSLD